MWLRSHATPAGPHSAWPWRSASAAPRRAPPASSGSPTRASPTPSTRITSTGTWENRIIGDMFLGLTTEAADGSVIPGAAESWEVSDDGLVYTFKLRDHSWSDGVPVTADDFVFAFRRILDPADRRRIRLAPVHDQECQSDQRGRDRRHGRSSACRRSTPRPSQITLESPTPYFLEQLTHYTAFPLPKHKVEELGDDWVKPGNIVGNGPYTVVEWVPNDHIKSVKNQAFYDADHVSIDSVTFYPAEERNAATKRFRAGEIDVQYDFASEQIDWLKENLPEETRIAPYLGIYYYAINTPQAAVRQPGRAPGAGARDRPRGDHRQDPAHRRAAGLQLRAAGHRQLRRARLRRLEGHGLSAIV